MNIGFLEMIVDNGDISFIRSKFCYNFGNNNANECIILKEDYGSEPFMKDYIDKFLYKFLYYFKDMDCMIGLDIDEGIKILLERINKATNNDRYSFVFHNSFKIIDLKYRENCDLFFNLIGLKGDNLKEYPYQTSLLNKSEILSSIFESIGGVFNAKLYNDTLFGSKGTVLINPEKIIIEEKPKINNHFTLLKDGYKAEGRILDLNRGNDSRFILSKGSFGNINASYKKDKKLREAFLKRGKIEYGLYFMNILEDIQFQSPKLAADFLFGNSKGENEYWIDDEGNPIDINNYSKYGDIETDNIGINPPLIPTNVNITPQTPNNIINPSLPPKIGDEPDMTVPENSPSNIYYLKKGIVDARGMFLEGDLGDGKSFVILKDSKGDKRITNSFKARNSLMSKWKELKNEKFVYDKNNIILTDDVIFKSPHEASCIIQGTTSGKATDWFNKDGIPLDYNGGNSSTENCPINGEETNNDKVEIDKEILDSYRVSFDYASNENTIDLLKIHCSKLEIIFNVGCKIKSDFYSKLQFLKCKDLCIKGIPNCDFYSDTAKYISLFKGDVLEIGIDGGTFRYDTLRELVKFKGDYLILSGFDLLQEGQPNILVDDFKGNILGVHGKLPYDQKKFFEDYEGITYSDDEKLAYIEEKEYKDVYDFESDGNYDENDEFNFYSKGVVREDEENGHLKITGDHLTDERAEKYSMYNGNILELNLTHLNNAQVKFISHFKGNILIIGGKESISDDQAKSLSHFKGKEIKLTSVRQLSDRQSAFLSYFKGDKIDLPALDDN